MIENTVKNEKVEDSTLLADLHDQLEYFESRLPELLESHAGWFVAIQDRSVVDKDPDEFELARRIERNRPKNTVLIRQVKHGDEEVCLDSPEVGSH